MRQAILVLKALAYPGLPEVSLRHLDVSLYCNVVVCVLHMSVALRLHVHESSCVFMTCAGRADHSSMAADISGASMVVYLSRPVRGTGSSTRICSCVAPVWA